MSTMLYKHPGPHEIHGDKFDYVIVEDDAIEAAIKDGWALTTDEAKAGPAKPKRGRKRARDEDGQFAGDDPATPDVNEAFEE